MSLPLLLDENVRGPLWQAIRRHNVVDPAYTLDIVRVGDISELPLGLDDQSILQWCEFRQRILVTHDLESMPNHVQQHLQAGRTLPGVFLVRKGFSIRQIVEQLVLLCHGGSVEDFRDQLVYIPQ